MEDWEIRNEVEKNNFMNYSEKKIESQKKKWLHFIGINIKIMKI